MKKKKEKYILKPWIKKGIIILLLLGVIFPSIRLYINNSPHHKKKDNSIYNAKIDKNVDYKIQLYDNNFVENNEMGADQVYISDLVKNIKLELLYTYSAAKKSNLKYTYDVNAKLYGENINSSTGGNEKVWEKDYTLITKVTKKLPNTSGFNITSNFNLDYPKYKQEVTNFKRQFGMNLTTNLKITMNINITGKYKNKNINKKDKIVLEIPLGVQAFSIKKDFKKEDFYKIMKESKNENPAIENYIDIIIIITSILLFLLSYKLIFNIKPKSEYHKKLDKILREYDQIIVEVETKIQEKGNTIIIVKDFDEMVDLEEELRIPIILYETESKATFTISYNDTIYKYEIEE